LFFYNYRDLKLDNVLVKATDEGLEMKLADFGTAKYFINQNENEYMTLELGSIYYIPPEVILNKYTELCDIWSLGVITFSLLTGRFPFDDDGSTDKEVIKN
jgi:calcium-dependent protein kinase